MRSTSQDNCNPPAPQGIHSGVRGMMLSQAKDVAYPYDYLSWFSHIPAFTPVQTQRTRQPDAHPSENLMGWCDIRNPTHQIGWMVNTQNVAKTRGRISNFRLGARSIYGGDIRTSRPPRLGKGILATKNAPEPHLGCEACGLIIVAFEKLLVCVLKDTALPVWCVQRCEKKKIERSTWSGVS